MNPSWLVDAERLVEMLRSGPCRDCGRAGGLTFDHVRPKTFDIADRSRWCTAARLLSELAKCELVCRQCHDVREVVRSDRLSMIETCRVINKLASISQLEINAHKVREKARRRWLEPNMADPRAILRICLGAAAPLPSESGASP